ncbi:MAG: hypothetical protein RL291_2031 [Pseudomonadota bacterium]|jgi:uncharacterized damage-inducible protein DinB
MITPAHAQMMAQYNRWQNQSLYREASKLSDAERKADRGAFFKSIHATLSHLVFGDQIWLHRFANTQAPQAKTIAESLTAIPDWEDLNAQRAKLDEVIITWAHGLNQSALEGDLTWYSGAMGKNITRPRWLLITHMFNHQTHHRGQVHALLTGYGLKPDDTDIPFMP